jgi:hypothetical protein
VSREQVLGWAPRWRVVGVWDADDEGKVAFDLWERILADDLDAEVVRMRLVEPVPG